MRVIRRKQKIFVLFLLFLCCIWLGHEQNKWMKQNDQIQFNIEVLEWKLQDEDSIYSYQQQVYFLKQKQSDLKLQRDLLMNYSLELRRDIDTLEEEIDTIERR